MAAPVITTHPTSLISSRGSTFTLSVTATGSVLTYQWYKDTWPITGQTSNTLIKNNYI